VTAEQRVIVRRARDSRVRLLLADEQTVLDCGGSATETRYVQGCRCEACRHVAREARFERKVRLAA
jgi:hypothetical protein